MSYVLNVKALEDAFNQEKAIVGVLSVNVNTNLRMDIRFKLYCSCLDQEEGESVLAEHGIRLAYVRGDVTTNAIVMVVDSEVLVR